MSDAVPIPLQPTLRALEVLDTVPARHVALYVAHDRWEPHIAEGELAIVDTADKGTDRGELYAMRLEDSGVPGGHRPAIVQMVRGGPQSDHVGLWFRYGWPVRGEWSVRDGPLRREYWPSKCIGRVVGVLVPAMVEA